MCYLVDCLLVWVFDGVMFRLMCCYIGCLFDVSVECLVGLVAILIA